MVKFMKSYSIHKYEYILLWSGIATALICVFCWMSLTKDIRYSHGRKQIVCSNYQCRAHTSHLFPIIHVLYWRWIFNKDRFGNMEISIENQLTAKKNWFWCAVNDFRNDTHKNSSRFHADCTWIEWGVNNNQLNMVVTWLELALSQRISK